jgi:CheY-like chemotaxis protein
MTHRKRKVLLVEDDALVRMFVLDLLEDHRCDVIERWDAVGALEALAVEKDVALLVTDVTLPGGRSGAEIAAEARKLNAGLPVLFTTGHSDFRWNDRVGHGEVAVLLKPFEVAAFSRLLARLLPR